MPCFTCNTIENGGVCLRKWRFSKTLSRVEVFENGGSASLCGRAKTEVFENDYVSGIGMSQLKKQNGYFLIRFRWSSVDGRKRCKNASVDKKLFIRFQETENGAVFENALVWTGPELISKTDLFVSQLATIRGRYRTMRDDDQSTQEGFIMGFSNPLTESAVGAADSTDSRVTVIGYRPLREDAGHGSKGNMFLPFTCDCTGDCREPVGVLIEINFNSLFSQFFISPNKKGC